MIKAHVWQRVYRDISLADNHYKCIYCHCPLPRIEATADHKKPKSKGGLTNKENIVPACKKCNTAKGTMSHNQFMNNIKHPENKDIKFLLCWMNRRIGLATERSIKNIEMICK